VTGPAPIGLPSGAGSGFRQDSSKGFPTPGGFGFND
jgi:hypothetical protein